jgi:hypothetical protein
MALDGDGLDTVSDGGRVGVEADADGVGVAVGATVG